MLTQCKGTKIVTDFKREVIAAHQSGKAIHEQFEAHHSKVIQITHSELMQYCKEERLKLLHNDMKSYRKYRK